MILTLTYGQGFLVREPGDVDLVLAVPLLTDVEELFVAIEPLELVAHEIREFRLDDGLIGVASQPLVPSLVAVDEPKPEPE